MEGRCPQEPKLAGIDPGKVIHFLAHLSLGAPWQPAEPKAPDPEPQGEPVQIKLVEGTVPPNRVPARQWFFSRQHALLRRVSFAGAAVLLVFGAVQIKDLVRGLHMRSIYGRAVAFQPDYPATPATEAWVAFRQARPYPYQGIAIKALPDSSYVIIISEPSPSLSNAALDGLLDKLFQGEIDSKQRLRWSLGIDGWVEDVVLHLPARAKHLADPMDDPVFRDRIAMVQLALFGTTYGGDVENLDASFPAKQSRVAANLQITPHELRAWLEDASFRWYPLIEDTDVGQNWMEISASSRTQTLRSGDGSIIMLTFPTRLLQDAKKDAGV